MSDTAVTANTGLDVPARDLRRDIAQGRGRRSGSHAYALSKLLEEPLRIHDTTFSWAIIKGVRSPWDV